MLAAPVSRLAEAGGDAEARLAHLVLLLLARRVLAHDASVDPGTDNGVVKSFVTRRNIKSF